MNAIIKRMVNVEFGGSASHPVSAAEPILESLGPRPMAGLKLDHGKGCHGVAANDAVVPHGPGDDPFVPVAGIDS